MAATLTYNSLCSDILSYCERTNDALLIAQLPRIIMNAENRVATDLKVEGTINVVADDFTIGEPVVVKPAYWRDSVSFQGSLADGTKFNLYPRSYEYCRNFWPKPLLTDIPRFYSDYDFNHFLIVPTPSLVLPWELRYHCRLTPLDPANQTNWLTVNAPHFLFYSSMVEAQLFLKNTDKVTLWGGFYKDTLDGLDKEDGGRKIDATTVPS